MSERTLRCVSCNKELDDNYQDEMCIECLLETNIYDDEELYDLEDYLNDEK